VGWSFGTDLAIKYGHDPAVVGAVLISPPLRYSGDEDLERWAQSGRPLVAIVPEFDDYLRPDAARERLAVVPQAQVIDVPGAKHLFVGHTEEVLDAVVAAVAPARSPLPREWP
jgi:pimeloyl-ACP methyl ester carboxylesterase